MNVHKPRFPSLPPTFLLGGFLLLVPLATVFGNEILLNGGFEDGRLKPWEVRLDGGDRTALPEARVEESAAHEGKFGLRVVPPQGKESLCVVWQGMKSLDPEQLAKGLRVRASARLAKAAPVGTRKTYQFGVTFNCTYEDGTARWDSRNALGWFDPTKDGWQQVEFIWIPEKPLRSAQIRLCFLSSLGEVCFDDVSLEPQ